MAKACAIQLMQRRMFISKIWLFLHQIAELSAVCFSPTLVCHARTLAACQLIPLSSLAYYDAAHRAKRQAQSSDNDRTYLHSALHRALRKVQAKH